MLRREGAYFQALALPLTFGSYLWPPISAILFQTFFPWHFLLLKQKKKKHKEKENHIKKKCRERRELTFKLLLCLFTFGFCFWPLGFAISFQALSF